MKRILSAMLLIHAVCFASPSFAGGWYNGVTIQYLYAGNLGGRYAIKLANMSPNPDSCGGYDLFIDETSPKFKEIWSLLLTSYVAEKPVNVYLSGCGGPQNSPKVTDVVLGTM